MKKIIKNVVHKNGLNKNDFYKTYHTFIIFPFMETLDFLGLLMLVFMEVIVEGGASSTIADFNISSGTTSGDVWKILVPSVTIRQCPLGRMLVIRIALAVLNVA